MKFVIAFLLGGVSAASAQTYASPTYQNLTVRGAATASTLTVSGGATASTLTGDISASTAIPTGEPYSRTMANRFADVVNVKDWGAVCDGTSHTLASVWPGKSLAQVQALYPSVGVTSLSQQADWAAIQQAIFQAAATSKAMVIPGGVCLHEPAGYQGLSGIDFDGMGVSTLKLASGAPTNAAISFGARDNWRLHGLTIDGTSYGAIPLVSAAGNNWEIERVNLIHVPRFGFAVTQSADWRVSKNRCTVDAPTGATTNQCLNVSVAIGANTGGEVVSNRFIGSGINLNANRTLVAYNTISGWRFGSGITTAQDATNSHHLRILGNDVSDSGNGTDVNGTAPLGIENWAWGSTIVGNVGSNNSGNGIGQNSYVTAVVGNTTTNGNQSGTVQGAIISQLYPSDGSWPTGSNTIVGNTGGNTGGNTTVKFGYVETVGVSNSVVTGNNFIATASDAYNRGGVSPTDYINGKQFVASTSWTPGTIASGASVTKTITVPGLDAASATPFFGFSGGVVVGGVQTSRFVDLNVAFTGAVTAANTFVATIKNNSGVSVQVCGSFVASVCGAGTLSVTSFTPTAQ